MAHVMWGLFQVNIQSCKIRCAKRALVTVTRDILSFISIFPISYHQPVSLYCLKPLKILKCYFPLHSRQYEVNPGPTSHMKGSIN